MQRSLSIRLGFSLVEMLVTVTILSILASVAIPFAQNGALRAKEVELKRSLREIRAAIDKFHHDCETNLISSSAPGVSSNCYPETLDSLVSGIEPVALDEPPYRYLRRIPRDPFSSPELEPEENWSLRSYTDSIDSTIWGGGDIYDVYVSHDRVSISGDQYSQW